MWARVRCKLRTVPAQYSAQYQLGVSTWSWASVWFALRVGMMVPGLAAGEQSTKRLAGAGQGGDVAKGRWGRREPISVQSRPFFPEPRGVTEGGDSSAQWRASGACLSSLAAAKGDGHPFCWWFCTSSPVWPAEWLLSKRPQRGWGCVSKSERVAARLPGLTVHGLSLRLD
jgi:hypothetical protein